MATKKKKEFNAWGGAKSPSSWWNQSGDDNEETTDSEYLTIEQIENFDKLQNEPKSFPVQAPRERITFDNNNQNQNFLDIEPQKKPTFQSDAIDLNKPIDNFLLKNVVEPTAYGVGKTLEIVDRPRNAFASMLQAERQNDLPLNLKLQYGIDPNKFDDPGNAFIEGLTGKRKTSGLESLGLPKQILDKATSSGVLGAKIPDAVPLLGGQNLSNLLLESVMDPLNILTMGAAEGIGALRNVAKPVSKIDNFKLIEPDVRNLEREILFEQTKNPELKNMPLENTFKALDINKAADLAQQETRSINNMRANKERLAKNDMFENAFNRINDEPVQSGLEPDVYNQIGDPKFKAQVMKQEKAQMLGNQIQDYMPPSKFSEVSNELDLLTGKRQPIQNNPIGDSFGDNPFQKGSIKPLQPELNQINPIGVQQRIDEIKNMLKESRPMEEYSALKRELSSLEKQAKNPQPQQITQSLNNVYNDVSKYSPISQNKQQNTIGSELKIEQPKIAQPKVDNSVKLNIQKFGDDTPIVDQPSIVDDLLKNSDNFKDKHPLALQRETWDRNIVDIAGKEDGGKIKEYLFDPIKKNESESIRWANKWRDEIKKFKLSKPESELVQKLGEGKISEQELIQLAPKSAEKIKSAVNAFRQFYDEAINTANEVLVKNGYDPVPKLDNYFPHFEGDDPIMRALGIKLDLVDLPTDINGLTYKFKPGKNFFGNFLKREGDQTTFDAVQGFDRYLEGVRRVIYHTDDIQRLRDFNLKLRSKYAPDGIKQQISKIYKMRMSKDAKDAAVQEYLGQGMNSHLSNAVADLEEYTNVLAGKKDLADRAAERQFGRQIYNIANVVTSRIGKNMVAINPASWITNFIPLTQSLATTSKDSFAKAMLDTIKNVVKNDGFVNKSTFLTNRVGTDPLDKSIVDKAGDMLSAPFKGIDTFTSQVVTRAKYLEGIKKGLTPEEALKKADEWAGKMIGDRSIGSQPTIFNQRSPITSLFKQFQLEVNNQLSFLFKDLPREYFKDGVNAKNAVRLSNAVGQLLFYGWLYNQVYEYMTGRRPALDPIGIAFGVKDDSQNENLKASDVVFNAGKNVAQSIPFVGSLLGGGRLPISTALPDLAKVGEYGTKTATGEMDTETGLKKVGKEFAKTAYYTLPPFGGGQAKKVVEGLDLYSKGGEFDTNVSGEEYLKFPISKTPQNLLKSVTLGKGTLDESVNYYKNKTKPLSEEQTAVFNAAVSQGIDPQQLYDQFIELRQLKPTGRNKTVTQAQKIRELKNNENFSAEQVKLLRQLMFSKKKNKTPR